MRGRNTLYHDLIPSSLPDALGEKSQRNTLINERDDALATRYYFHAHLCRKRYEDCLTDLSGEFFLTPNVIVQRLSLRVELIRELVAKEATPTELRRRYPYYNWTEGIRGR